MPSWSQSYSDVIDKKKQEESCSTWSPQPQIFSLQLTNRTDVIFSIWSKNDLKNGIFLLHCNQNVDLTMAGVTRSFGNSGPLIFIALLLCILHQSLALSGLHNKNDAVSIKDEQRILKNGMAQIISSIPPNYESSASSPGKPPILFLHGSFHAAWCW